MSNQPFRRLIVIIEDTPEDIAIIHSALIEARIDHPLYFYAQGVEAVEVIKYYTKAGMPPALIIQDWRLPDISGLELLRTLKDNPLTADIHLVVLTAYSANEIKDESLRLGAVAFMEKTLPSKTYTNQLLVVLKQVLNGEQSSEG